MATIYCGSVYLITTVQQNTPPHHMQRCYRLDSRQSKNRASSRAPGLSAAVQCSCPCASSGALHPHCTASTTPQIANRLAAHSHCALSPGNAMFMRQVPARCLLYQATLPQSHASNTSQCSNFRYQEACCHRPSHGACPAPMLMRLFNCQSGDHRPQKKERTS